MNTCGKGELARRERDLPAVDLGHPRPEVEADATRVDLGGLAPPGVARRRARTRASNSSNREGLGQVVVGAHVEGPHRGVELAFGGEDEDRQELAPSART